MFSSKQMNDSARTCKTVKLYKGAASAILVSTLALGGLGVPTANADGYVDASGNLLYSQNETYNNTSKYVDVDYTFGKYNPDTGIFDTDQYGDYARITYTINKDHIWWFIRQYHWFTLPENMEDFQKIIFSKKESPSSNMRIVGHFTTQTWQSNSRYYAFKSDAGKFDHHWNSMTSESFNYNNDGNTLDTTREYKKNTDGIFVDFEKRGNIKTQFTVIGKIKDKKKPIYAIAGIYQGVRSHRFTAGKKIEIPQKPPIADVVSPTIPPRTLVNKVDALDNAEKNKVKEAIYKAQTKEFQLLLPKGKDSISVDQEGNATITYTDNTTDKILGTNLVVRRLTWTERVIPVIPVPTPVNKLGDLSTAETETIRNKIWNANNLSDNFNTAIGGRKENITVDKTGKATIKYIDGSTKIIEANALTRKQDPYANRITPLFGRKTGVAKINSLSPTEIQKLKDRVWDENKNNPLFIEATQGKAKDSIQVSSNGTVTITYKDNSKDTINSSDLVYQIPPMSNQYNIKTPVKRLGVKNPDSIDSTIQNKLKDDIWNANPELQDNKLKNGKEGISVDNKGNATVTFQDGSKTQITRDYLIYKQGESSAPEPKLVSRNGYKFYLRPLIVENPNAVDKNDWANFARIFFYDNYDYTNRPNKINIQKNGSSELNSGPLNGSGSTGVGNLSYSGGWRIGKDFRPYGTNIPGAKPRLNTQNMNFPTNYNNGIFALIETGKLEVQRLNNYGGPETAFEISKAEAFITNGGAFNPQEAQKEADNLIDKLVKDEGLSKEEAEKIKQKIKTEGTDQSKIDELINKAKEQAAKDTANKKLEEAKKQAKQVVDVLNNINPTDKTKILGEITNAANEDQVRQKVDEAKKKDAEAKQKADDARDLNNTKQKAEEIIKKLENLDKNKQQELINEAKSKGTISDVENVIKKAQEQNKAEGDKKAKAKELADAKTAAENAIDKLPTLSETEKNSLKQEVKNAGTVDAVNKVVEKANQKEAEEAKKLADKKAEAKKKIEDYKYLNEEQKKNFINEINKAPSIAKVNEILGKAEKQNTTNAKEYAKKLIDPAITGEKRKEAEKQIDQTNSPEEALKATDKANIEELKKKAKEKINATGLLPDRKTHYTSEVDKITKDTPNLREKIAEIVKQAELEDAKNKAKEKIKNMDGLSDDDRQKYNRQLDDSNQTTSPADADAIVESARLQAKIKEAVSKVEALSNINNKQKQYLKEMVESSGNENDIAQTVADAQQLDTAMKKLKETAEEAKKVTGSGANKITLDKLVGEADSITNKTTGENVDAAKIDRLIKEIIETAKKLGKTIDNIADETNLQSEFEKAKQTKSTDAYNKAYQTRKSEFDKAYNKAQELLNKMKDAQQKKTVTQQELDQAQNDLVTASTALDGAERKMLEEAIATSETTKASYKYTAETDQKKKNTFDTALSNAKDLKNKQENTQQNIFLPTREELAEATKTLVQAQKALTGKSKAETATLTLADNEKVAVDNIATPQTADAEKVKNALTAKYPQAGISKVEVTDESGQKKFKVTFNDGSHKTISPSEVTRNKKDNERYTVQVPQTGKLVPVDDINNPKGDELTKIANAIKEANTAFKNKIKEVNIETIGNAKKIVVKFQDDSKSAGIELNKVVRAKKDNEKYTLSPVPEANRVPVENVAEPNSTELPLIETAIKNANPTAKDRIQSVTLENKQGGGKNLKITFKDSTTANMELANAVRQKTQADKADFNKTLTDSEKVGINTPATPTQNDLTAITEALKKAYPQANIKNVTVENKTGSTDKVLKVEFNDGSHKTLEPTHITRAKNKGEKTNIPPLADNEKVAVENTNQPDTKELSLIKNALQKANPQSGITKVELVDEGNKKKAKITFDDNSSTTVELSNLVREKNDADRFTFTPLDDDNKVAVDNKDQIADGENQDITAALKKQFPNEKINKAEVVTENGNKKIKITFEDNSTKTVSATDVVRNKKDNEKFTINSPQAENKVPVNDVNNPQGATEMKAIEDAIKTANPTAKDRIQSVTVETIAGKKKVKITFKDTTTTTLDLKNVVRAKKQAEIEPATAPTQEFKVPVKNKNALTPEEEKKIIKAVYDSNQTKDGVRNNKIKLSPDKTKVVVEREDGSSNEIPITDVIREYTQAEQKRLTPLGNKIAVDNLDSLKDDEKTAIISAIKNQDTNITGVEYDNVAKIFTATYKDSSKNTIALKDVARSKTLAERVTLNPPSADNKVPVDDVNNPKGAEIGQIQKSIVAANTTLNITENMVSVDTTLTPKVVKVTFSDGSVKTIELNKVVRAKTEAEKNGIVAPSVKVPVVNVDTPTADEQALIKKAVAEANRDKNITEAMISFDMAQKQVVVTFGDNSKITLKLTDVARNKTQAENNPLVAPQTNARVKVNNPNALTDSEVNEIKQLVAQTNQGKVAENMVTVDKTTGIVTVTYPSDNSTNTFTPEKVLVEKTTAEKTSTLALPDDKKVGVDNTTAPTADELTKVKETLVENYPQLGISSVEIVNENGTNKLKVIFDDNSAKIIQLNDVVRAKTQAESNPAVAPKSENKVPVDDTMNPNDKEIDKIKEVVSQANKDKGISKDDVTVDKTKGIINVRHKDGSTTVIPLDNVVRPKTNAESNPAVTPNDKGKIGVVNPSKLTPSEIDKIKQSIIDANKGKGITKDNITIDTNRGIVTVTYPDGSTSTLPLDSIIEKLPIKTAKIDTKGYLTNTGTDTNTGIASILTAITGGVLLALGRKRRKDKDEK